MPKWPLTMPSSYAVVGMVERERRDISVGGCWSRWLRMGEKPRLLDRDGAKVRPKSWAGFLGYIWPRPLVGVLRGARAKKSTTAVNLAWEMRASQGKRGDFW